MRRGISGKHDLRATLSFGLGLSANSKHDSALLLYLTLEHYLLLRRYIATLGTTSILMDRKRKRTLSNKLQRNAVTQSTQSSTPALKSEAIISRSKQECPDSADRYTIGWICALEEEYECACRMLDEEFSGPETDNKDDNTYVYGRIANHYVVIGCLPAGRYGTNSAARVARDMIRSFPHLRFASQG